MQVLEKQCFQKIKCYFFYYLGDLCCRLGFYKKYNFFMETSVDISDKYKLDIWKCVDKSENNS